MFNNETVIDIAKEWKLSSFVPGVKAYKTNFIELICSVAFLNGRKKLIFAEKDSPCTLTRVTK
jgi:hypothetical protein